MTRAGRTTILLNIYDLADVNQYTASFGIGLYHTGVEFGGDEYSYASGAGIFCCTPRTAPGATFRESIVLGEFNGSIAEAKSIAFSLSEEFRGERYNLLTRNCNSYSEALCQALLGISIPAYINRAAYFGSFLSCLLPSESIEQAPVGDTTASQMSGNLRGERIHRSQFVYSPFAGSGKALGGSTSAGDGGHRDLEDRREKVRLAALRRLEGDPALKES